MTPSGYTHTLAYSLELPLPREEVFAFFADAANLQLITPQELDFAIITPLPVEMKQGALIDYRLSLFGIPFSWQTEITEWAPPGRFVDRQLSGPYAEWVHCHGFRDGPGGTTVMTDDVRYRLPLAPLGELVLPLVRTQLERIFTYRRNRVLALLQAPLQRD